MASDLVPAGVDPQKADLWNDAHRLWLELQTSPNTRRLYDQSIQQLLAFCGAAPWQIRRIDIVRWTAHLKRNVADTTIAARLAGASSFYRFCSQDYTLTQADGSEIPLCPNNPMTGAARPRINPYNKATVMGVEGARAFLEAIPVDTVIGKRDYALFLGYLLTGRRNSEWRTLQYEDIELRPTGIVFRWTGKGKTRMVQELPEIVLAAIQEYAALEGDRSSGYVFHSYDFRGQILEQPVAGVTVRSALKYYARKAGLDWRSLRVHSLRHTAALLREKAGDSPEEIQQFLSHNNLATTQIYLHAIKGRQDTTWQTVAEMLGLES